MKIYLTSCVAALCALLAAYSTAFCQTCPGSAGCLDPTFGNGGKTIFPAPNLPLPTSIHAESDGKIVTMGRGTTTYGHKLTRINADGTPDAGFGSGGIASFVWSGGNANDFAIQTVNGTERLLVAGTGTATVGRKTVGGRLRIDRLMLDGTYDPSWGSNGVLAVDLNSAYAIAVQPDQKILLSSATYGTLTRLNANGSLDTSFGNSGTVDCGDGREIRLDASGRIYVAGIYSTGKGNNVTRYFSIRRFSPSGVLDTSFGNSGLALTPPQTIMSFAVAIDVNGNIIIVSSVNPPVSIERFAPTGQVDTSFSSDGFVALPDAGNPVSVDTDPFGRVVVASNVSSPATPGATDVGVVRINYDGSLDSTFGNGGKVGIDIGGYYDFLGSVILQTDPACACEKIVTAGGTTGGSSNQATFARLLAQ